MIEQAPSGLSNVVHHGELRHKTSAGVRRFVTTGFDIELLAAVDAAATARVPLALVIPLPAANTPIVLGAAALVAEVVRERRLGVSATVVSGRLSQRAYYDLLYIGQDRLADHIPRARLTADGTIETVGSARHDSGGRMLLTSDPSRAAGRSGALVIDGAGGDLGDVEAIVRGGQPLVYLTDNPFDRLLDVIRDSGGVVWAFDPPALTLLTTRDDALRGEQSEALAAPVALLAAAGAARRAVWAPADDSPLDGTLRHAWTALGRLATVEAQGTEHGAAHGLRWAWGTLATYSLLATTPDHYDRHQHRGPFSTTLREAASHARAVAGNRSRATREAWAHVADAFSQLHTAAGAATKLPLVQSWINALSDDGRSGLLVTRNRAAVAALTAALEESTITRHGWREHVRVVSARDVLLGRVDALPVGTMLVTGPLPRAYASLVAAPPADEALTATAGAWEASRAARQIEAALQALRMLREQTRTVSSSRLGMPATRAPAQTEWDTVTVWRAGAALTRAEPIGADGSPWAPFDLDVLAVAASTPHGRDGAPEVAPPARGDDRAAHVHIHAITITFIDGVYLHIDPNDVVYRRRGNDSGRAAAKSLLPGDVIALVDSTARRDLFDTVIDALSELPKYAPLATLVAFWHQRVARVRDRGLALREILASMRAGPDPTGLTTEAAIGHWFRGLVAGPADPVDVRRFAVAVGDRELVQRADAVGRALHTSRVLNRAVGRWLSAQITGARLHNDDAIVDPDLGVHVADLLEAVSLHQVASVDPQQTLVTAAAVGVLRTAAAAKIPGRSVG
ncbi:hypothetical protein I0C86_20850 [Plantactinospora sp. S1510]|uniref:DISARM protein DrmE C-terminal domain-containing protein n=1 Tax=Plantactinospora alkalitolerans TaxID=2789879 RepID=A0ABS0GYX4_9ACTN|nr:hypothetical protein [Plantactinospora alkalitolerans]MBF9131392.1 hypothetical protein [Plantactinospora alkalitolerans]